MTEPAVFCKPIGLYTLFRERADLLSDLAADPTPLIPSRQWEDAVFDEGFYDQSHFIHDFRSFTGYAPGALPRENFYMYRILTKPGFGEGCAHVQSEK